MKRSGVLMHCIWFCWPLAAIAEDQCRAQDPELISCSLPAAPRVAELRSGYVVLEVLVLPDGSVSDVEVRKAGGDDRWKVAAIAAVSRWRYLPRESSVTKIQRFDFGFSQNIGGGI